MMETTLENIGLGSVRETGAPADVLAARPDSVAGVMESLGRQDAEVWMGMGI